MSQAIFARLAIQRRTIMMMNIREAAARTRLKRPDTITRCTRRLFLPRFITYGISRRIRPGPCESNTKCFIDVPFFLFLLVLELVGALIKPFALCMRLFANMVAGHVVLAVLVLLIASGGSVLKDLALGIPLGGLDLMISFLEL